MNLNELKKMIAGEYRRYLTEQVEPAVTVDAGDVDAGEDENPEDTLKDIYDMLKDYFEGDDMDADMDDDMDADMDDDMEDDMEDDMDDEEDAVGALQERFKKLANIIKG